MGPDPSSLCEAVVSVQTKRRLENKAGPERKPCHAPMKGNINNKTGTLTSACVLPKISYQMAKTSQIKAHPKQSAANPIAAPSIRRPNLSIASPNQLTFLKWIAV